MTIFVSREGYFKKITPQSLRMSGEQKFKEGDSLAFQAEVTNRAELLVFTDKCQVYKAKCAEFDDGKASLLGDYLPAKLGMEPGENVVQVVLPGDYTGFVLFFFANGKAAKVPMEAYNTKSNRRKLTGAYSDKSPLKTILHLQGEGEIAVFSTEGRALIVNTEMLAAKSTRTTQGVAVLTLKPKWALDYAVLLEDTTIVNKARYRGRTLPSAGALLKPEDRGEVQLTLE